MNNREQTYDATEDDATDTHEALSRLDLSTDTVLDGVCVVLCAELYQCVQSESHSTLFCQGRRHGLKACTRGFEISAACDGVSLHTLDRSCQRRSRERLRAHGGSLGELLLRLLKGGGR